MGSTFCTDAAESVHDQKAPDQPPTVDILNQPTTSQVALNNDDDGKQDGQGKKLNVLYIFPLQRDYAAVDSLPQSVRDRYTFHFADSEHFSYSSKAAPEFSLVEFIGECIEAVTAKSIDMVISTRDIADVVHGVLAAHFEHIKGPNYFASFIAIYKPYTKFFVDTDNAIGYELVNLSLVSKLLFWRLCNQ